MSRKGGRGKVSHKGRRRHFTDEEDLKHDLEKAKREQEWRERRGELPSDEEGGDSDGDGSSEEEEVQKRKGVSGLIEIENPNRVQQKMKKASHINLEGNASAAPLSRREREEIAKQQEKLRYQKLHAEGKTEQARSDLARLAIIRKEREEAARKKQEEKEAREKAAAAKSQK